MEELWKDIPGFEGIYQVSNLGRVKTLSKIVNTRNGGRLIPETIISPIVQNSGYAHVGLWRNRKCKQCRVHRLVAFAFCENDDPTNKTQVNHINENKLDNRAENLEWCSPKYNTNYGNCIRKRSSSRAIPVGAYDIKTKKLLYTFNKIIEACRFCGVSDSDGHISSCCKGQQKTAYGYVWRYIEKEVMSNGQ